MNVKEDIEPITYMKTRSSELLRQVNETHRPVVITQNGEAMTSYQETRNALLMLKLMAQGEEDIRQGRVVPHEEAMALVEKKLAAMDKQRGRKGTAKSNLRRALTLQRSRWQNGARRGSRGEGNEQMLRNHPDSAAHVARPSARPRHGDGQVGRRRP
ncbi:MAG: type II toxin-antitoxin system Phd/YefM family antitoxin [Armatimonadetes bacterium]|nr:type II toxin-antitoxin system Phd/YefM family antitoxin [Armatimonadota bacterium]